VVLRGAAKDGNAAQAEVGAGTVIFSIPPAATLVISAGGATIQPDTTAHTIGQITFIDEKSFQISARKGALKVSYHDDSEVVPEGNSYRVELYRSDDSSTATAIAGKPRRSNRRKRIALFLIAGGAVAAAVAAGVATGGAASSSSSGVAKDFESPDHP
jgi:ferric-dicitrate binding protein FerR (iron transport regulator)